MAEATIESLQKELEHYKRKFSVSQYDIAMDGYLAYVNFVKQQVEYIKKFKVEENIDGKKADTAGYDRAISMGESLPKMITSMNNLKMELKIEFDDSEGKEKKAGVSPQSIGK